MPADPATAAVVPAGHTRRPILRTHWVVWLYRRARAVLALIGVLLLLYHAGFNLTAIASGSMSPTLQGEYFGTGDWVLSERISYWIRKPRRWEVVQFVNNDGVLVMKRIAGLPGEHVRLDDGRVVADGRTLPFPASISFLHYFAFGPQLYNGKSADCGPDGYFVLGDDSKDSFDSRYEGPLPRARIKSRAWLRVWPPSRVGFVNP